MDNQKYNLYDTKQKTSLFFDEGNKTDDLNLLCIFLSGEPLSDSCGYLQNLRSLRGYFHQNKKTNKCSECRKMLKQVEEFKKTTPPKFEKLIIAFHLLLISRSIVFIDIIFILQKKCWDIIFGLDGKLVNKFGYYLECQFNEIDRAIKYLKKFRHSYSHDDRTDYDKYLKGLGEKTKLCQTEIDFLKKRIKQKDFDKFKSDSLWAWDYLIALYFLNEFKILNIKTSPSIQTNKFMCLKGYINNLKTENQIDVDLRR